MAKKECTLNTSVWLKFNMVNRDRVRSLWCAVCSKFRDKLVTMHNFHLFFIEGTTNIQSTTFKEHTTTDMHVHAMGLFKKQHTSM